jgi:hypothetical protein
MVVQRVGRRDQHSPLPGLYIKAGYWRHRFAAMRETRRRPPSAAFACAAVRNVQYPARGTLSLK